jgi:hypothetical protein
MARLGDFGTERPAVEDSFGWFGSEVRVHPDISDLTIIGLFAAMQELGEEDGEKMIEAMGGIAAALVHPDDLDEFLGVARSHRQTMEDIATLAMNVIAALAERPTLLPSDSSAGQPTTAASSSSKALRVLDGRPDLQAAVAHMERAG